MLPKTHHLAESRWRPQVWIHKCTSYTKEFNGVIYMHLVPCWHVSLEAWFGQGGLAGLSVDCVDACSCSLGLGWGGMTGLSVDTVDVCSCSLGLGWARRGMTGLSVDTVDVCSYSLGLGWGGMIGWAFGAKSLGWGQGLTGLESSMDRPNKHWEYEEAEAGGSSLGLPWGGSLINPKRKHE